MLSKQFLSETAIELQHVQRSVFTKEVNTQNLCTFELETQEGTNVPVWVIVGSEQRDRQDSQSLKKLNNDMFHRPPVTGAQCIIET